MSAWDDWANDPGVDLAIDAIEYAAEEAAARTVSPNPVEPEAAEHGFDTDLEVCGDCGQYIERYDDRLWSGPEPVAFHTHECMGAPTPVEPERIESVECETCKGERLVVPPGRVFWHRCRDCDGTGHIGVPVERSIPVSEIRAARLVELAKWTRDPLLLRGATLTLDGLFDILGIGGESSE